jgi:hypothetical protein
MPTKSEFLGQQIEERFLTDFRELLAHFSSAAVFEGIRSFLSLNYTTEELTTAPVTPGGGFRKMLALALLTLIDREALVPLAEFNALAQDDLNKLRETGVDLDEIPAPVAPPPTAEEILEAEVRRDWKTLGMDGIRKKRAASRQYGLTLDRLANNNTLESSVTSFRQAQ